MNKTTLICLLAALLLNGCAEKMVCPAYQSAFILDEDYRRDYFSPFTVDAGDTVPKGGYTGQRYKSMSKEKEGFTYANRKKKLFKLRLWSNPERPVLENPYLLDRILKKRPYWKLDVLKPELIHYSDVDTVDLEVPMLTDSLGQPILDSANVGSNDPSYTILTVPKRYKGYNIDQMLYNEKFGHLFPQPPPPPEPIDSSTLKKLLADTTAADSTGGKKKGILGMFGKKKDKNKDKKQKPPKEKKKKDKKKKKKNDEGTREEEEGG